LVILVLNEFLKRNRISSVNFVIKACRQRYQNLRIGWFWFIRWFWFINDGFGISFSIHWFMVAIMMFVGWSMVVVVIHFSMPIIWIAPFEQKLIYDTILIFWMSPSFEFTVYLRPAGLYTGFGAGYLGSSWYLGAWL